jgi:rhomboid protease GluP
VLKTATSMKVNFQETIEQKTDTELEIISKDNVFYSEEERFIALNELAVRGKLTKELSELKKYMEYEREMEEDAKKPSHEIRFKDFFPQKDYFFTPILIYANILIFTTLILFGFDLSEPEILIQWGGNIRHLTINGQIWRLFTSLFLHAGVLHIAFNMYALLYIGSILERIIGIKRFIFAYVILGISASVSSLMVHEDVVSVGASGAIFGLFGMILPLFGKKEGKLLLNISVEKLMLNCSIFIGYSILTGFKESGIDNAAHIGGLVGGVIIGLFYSLIIFDKIRPIPIYVIVVLIFGFFSTLVITNVPDKIGEYERAIKEFSDNEQKALWMYQVNLDYIPNSQLNYYTDKLKEEGVDIWDENIELLENIKQNDYDGQIVKQIDILIDYAILRKKTCMLFIELLKNNSFETRQKLEETHIQIENKLTMLQDFQRSRDYE